MLTITGIGTAGWLEITWTLASIPGFILWSSSCISAKRSLTAARINNITNGRLLWAKFSVRLTGLLAFVELSFISIGIITMFRIANPDSTTISILVVASLFVTVSMFISLLAYQWRAVEAQILEIAKRRRAEKTQIEEVKNELDTRAMAQNTRDTDQNLRTFRQDEREKEL